MRYYYVTPAPVPSPTAVAEPYPAPEVPARVVALGDPEVPTGARRVAAAAAKAGWTVVATYARGTLGPPHARITRVVDSLALRMWRGERRAYAVWVDGRFGSAGVWGVGLCNATGLRAMLT